MSDFSIIDGVAHIHDPKLYETWLDREDYMAAVSASPDPAIAATKRLLVDFEATLARLVRDRTVEENVVEVMTKFIGDDYIQHDPNATGNGRDNLIEHFRKVPLGHGVPPPVVNVVVEGDLACVMMKRPMPDPAAPGQTYDWYILTVFRVRNGRLAEHWSAFQKMAAPLPSVQTA
jgi:predicted SnoaL-like aldol condensation-catalyzing enzyme